MRAFASRIPLTLALVSAALLASFVPGAPDALLFERSSVLRGEGWRLASAHLVHSWPKLAAVDLSVLLVLGAWLERRTRAGWIATLLASAAASSAAVWFARPDLEHYQGSSALATGVFAMLAVSLALEEGRGPVRLAALAALALLVWKTWSELAGSGPTWLAAPLPPGVQAVAEAHAAAGVAGALVAVVGAALQRGSARPRRSTLGAPDVLQGFRERRK